MATLLRHLLAFVCGLTLALPPGWCCALSQFGLRGTGTPTSGCCQGAGEQQEPATPKAPTPDRSQPCGCVDRNTPPEPGKPRLSGVDFAASSTLAPTPVFSPESCCVTLPRVAIVHSPPFHVLHCVWLC